MGSIRVTIVDHSDNDRRHVKRYTVTRPHSLASHGRVRNNAIRALELEGRHLTVTTNGSEM